MPNTETTVINQFAINNIIQTPCDAVFLNLLSQTIQIERPYDIYEGVKKVNEYGEVVLTYDIAQVAGIDIPARIDPISQRGKTGFVVQVQGGEVFATFKVFLCPEVDVRENDTIVNGTRKYQVLLVEDLYGAETMHHKELLCRRVDNL
jgi:hypothetical protein